MPPSSLYAQPSPFLSVEPTLQAPCFSVFRVFPEKLGASGIAWISTSWTSFRQDVLEKLNQHDTSLGQHSREAWERTCAKRTTKLGSSPTTQPDRSQIWHQGRTWRSAHGDSFWRKLCGRKLCASPHFHVQYEMGGLKAPWV